MKIIIEKNYDEMSKSTANIMLAAMMQDKRVNVSITGGASPVGTYEIVTQKVSEQKTDFVHVHYYSFDYAGYAAGVQQPALADSLYSQYFDPAGVEKNNIHILNEENYKTYDAEIADNGGLDLMVIGMGADGHFCGNMPTATVFDRETYMIQVKEEYPWYATVKAAMCKDDSVPMPTHFITMGAASLMKVRQLVMLVNGSHKADAVKRLMESPVSIDFPSSILKLHPNFTVILDSGAAAKM